MSKKYDIDKMYSTSNNLQVTIDKTGSKSMIREVSEDKATMRQGYRIRVNGDTICYGDYTKTKEELLLSTIKTERYAHLAYKELYYDLLHKLASIGLTLVTDNHEESNG